MKIVDSMDGQQHLAPSSQVSLNQTTAANPPSALSKTTFGRLSMPLKQARRATRPRSGNTAFDRHLSMTSNPGEVTISYNDYFIDGQRDALERALMTSYVESSVGGNAAQRELVPAHYSRGSKQRVRESKTLLQTQKAAARASDLMFRKQVAREHLWNQQEFVYSNMSCLDQ